MTSIGSGTAAPRLTPLQWLICAIAALGFAALLELDLVEGRRLDLDVAHLDLANIDAAEEGRR